MGPTPSSSAQPIPLRLPNTSRCRLPALSWDYLLRSGRLSEYHRNQGASRQGSPGPCTRNPRSCPEACTTFHVSSRAIADGWSGCGIRVELYFLLGIGSMISSLLARILRTNASTPLMSFSIATHNLSCLLSNSRDLRDLCFFVLALKSGPFSFKPVVQFFLIAARRFRVLQVRLALRQLGLCGRRWCFGSGIDLS